MRKTYNKSLVEGKTKLTKAFKLLRKKGLIAKQNFSCCASCGTYELNEIGNEKGIENNGVYPAGFVFYHKQDYEDLTRSGYVHIRYAGFYNKKDKLRKGSLSDVKIGKTIVEVMNEIGLRTEWDGDPNRCIKVVI